MPEVPAIFHVSQNIFHHQIPVHMEISSRWAEFVAHLSQFSELPVPETRIQLEQLLNHEAHPESRAMLLSGIGRCRIHEGDFIQGAQTLGHAYSLIGDQNTQAQAMVILEMVSFLAIIGQYDLALMLLDRVPNLTQVRYLAAIANYYWAVLKTRQGCHDIVRTLEESARYFESIDEWAILAYHYKNIGNVHRRNNNCDAANAMYRKALKLSSSQNYHHIEAAILHDIGMMRFRQGLDEAALESMHQAFETAESHYTRCFCLGNIGFVYVSRKCWSEASAYLQRAINIAGRQGVFSIIPSITYHLGLCYENLDQPDLAFHFYRQGHSAATELLNHHFPYTGDRKRVIEKFTDILDRDYSGDTPIQTPSDLSFTVDRTLQEIRAVFQGAVLDIILQKQGSAVKAASKLGIARRSIFSIRERVKKNSNNEIPVYVKEFVDRHADHNWKELNHQFEGQVLVYLYQVYGRNKKVMSQKLGISYPHLVNMTRNIETLEHSPAGTSAVILNEGC